jgi:hypothetical protein
MRRDGGRCGGLAPRRGGSVKRRRRLERGGGFPLLYNEVMGLLDTRVYVWQYVLMMFDFAIGESGGPKNGFGYFYYYYSEARSRSRACSV